MSKSAEKLRAEIEKKSIDLHTRAFGRMESEPEEEINPLNRSAEILLRVADELEEVKSYLNASIGIMQTNLQKPTVTI
ncbi:MAG: hypothetical protein K2N22_06775 [Clostridia bacterium]|nr:hypothetical protein [Clostridia bacterium]